MVLAGASAALGVGYLASVYVYATWPSNMNTGYAPTQPVPFSHKLHAGDLKMDCRYCHNTVEVAGHAAVPPTATCVNCHAPKDPATGQAPTTSIFVESPRLDEIHKSYLNNEPVQWERVHDLADYVYFNHAAHVNRGVGCVECHGRVDKMETVWQDKSLSMAFCLECHRDPVPRLRPRSEITNLAWERPEDAEAHKKMILEEYGEIHATTSCSTCHR